MELLNKIESPKDLKNLNTTELIQLCGEIRSFMIERCAENPGHLGSSLGAIELAVAIHKVFNTPKDKLVWDVGHQAYAHKIITGRRDLFANNRKFGGISGFPKMSESPYDSFGVGHSSTSISAALGMAVADKLSGGDAMHIAVIGDGALTGGLSFEAINNAGSIGANILVILNDNQISIDKNIGGLHNYLMQITTSSRYNKIKGHVWNRLGNRGIRRSIQSIVKGIKRFLLRTANTNSYFDAFGFRYFGPIDGNDVEQLVYTLERLKDIKGPKILHAITTKGNGYKPAEENPTAWHAPGLFDPETGEMIRSESGADRYQVVFGTSVTELAKRDSRIVGITPAMLSGGSLNIMQKELPERVFDVGIAEGHAVTFSAGLAASGMIPFCNIYSSFSQRAYDNLIHDVALQNLKVIFTFDRAGIVGEDGPTHHGVFDMSAFRPIPNLAIVSPLNEIELKDMLYSATDDTWPATIIRYPRGSGVGLNWREHSFQKVAYGKADLLSDGKDVAILSIGPVGNICSEVVNKAANEGKSILHYDMKFLKPIDKDALKYACSVAKHIITVEDGTIKGGLYGEVCEYVASNALCCKVTGVGIPDKFIEQGSVKELYKQVEITVDDIYNKTRE